MLELPHQFIQRKKANSDSRTAFFSLLLQRMSLGGKYVRAKNNCLIFLLVRFLLEDKAFRLKGIYVQGEKTTNNPPPRNGAVEIRLLLIVTPVPCSPTPDQRSQWEGSFRFHHCVGKLRFPNGHVFSQTRPPVASLSYTSYRRSHSLSCRVSFFCFLVLRERRRRQRLPLAL